MDIKKKDELILQRKDLIGLINDIERIISKQENLVCYGIITEEKGKENIDNFKSMIQINLDRIIKIEEKLLKDHGISLKY